jgi:hypothetical protein
VLNLLHPSRTRAVLSGFKNINGEPLMRLITALKLFGPELSNLIEERARARFGG